MKSTISILLFFALPFLIYGGKISKYYSVEVEYINKLAKNGTEINEALLLKKDGFLGEGGFGFVYEGTIKENNRPVAIKFVKNEDIFTGEREMAMYSYLNAYQNESVEKYGIPCVYYYGRWENYILMAFTKFDMNLEEVAEKVSSFGENPLDILILLRDFVYQSKYLHSHGVRHDDLKPENIMLRGHRSFLIDLDGSSKMMEDECHGKKYEKRRAIDDYGSFICVIRRYWLRREYDDNESRKNRLGTEKIIVAFADEVFTDDSAKQFPNYNNLEKMISNEIKTIHPNGEPRFSWITTDAETNPTRKITDIAEPKSIDFTKFIYPPIAVQLPTEQTTQTSMPTRKRSSSTIFGSSSKQRS